MKITVLHPYGWCEGVAVAVQQLNQIIKKHKNKKICLIGWIVHNKHLIKDFTNRGVIVLDDTKHSRLSLLKSIKDPNTVVILSAHGTPYDAIRYGSAYFKNFYDLTCKYVKNNIDLVKKLTKQGDYVIYYGKKNHPESNAILAIDSSVVIVESAIDIWKLKLDKNKRYVLINQSTIAKDDVNEVVAALSVRTQSVNYINSTCDATNQRHKNILNLKKVDLLLVIGDSHSNNVNQLVNLAKKRNINVALVNSKEDIKKMTFAGIKHVAITSGTSTSLKEVNEIVDYIKKTI
ncbi:MAG: 4-hydroxy-3-methylbut-2-enyl diphosphate reductase [Mycoplasmataceae bacterium]|nr:4-hydroxy-3-methylbut-2-enyl diphosphate reductase [Mycoplasmataceae bacterium]